MIKETIRRDRYLAGRRGLHFNTKPGGGTGIIGITFRLERIRRVLQGGGSRLYVMPVFAISTSSCPTNSNCTSVSIGQFGLERAWRKSVETLCYYRGFSKAKGEELIGKCPSKERFIRFLNDEYQREPYPLTIQNLKRWRLSSCVSIEEFTLGKE